MSAAKTLSPTPLGGVPFDAFSNAPDVQTAQFQATYELIKRINITLNASSTAEQNATYSEDPWQAAGQYGLGWVYFCIALLAFATVNNIYRSWTDKIRRGLHKEVVFQQQQAAKRLFQPRPYGFSMNEVVELETPQSTNSTIPFFFPPPQVPRNGEASSKSATWGNHSLESGWSRPFVHKIVSCFRFVLYRPTPTFWVGRTMLSFASFHNIAIIGAAIIFVACFTFLPQPYFYLNANDGAPPLAVRAGMIAVALVPWIIASSMKVNLISVMTGIGHERLSVLHRWGGYLCLALSIIHVVPFYVQPVWSDNALQNIYYPAGYFWQTPYVYGSGLACLAPLAFLCLHSLPILRSKLYELFVILHIPVSIVFLAMMFWHTANKLITWGYLGAAVGVWATSLLLRVFFMNWTMFWRKSWMKGEAATVTILPEKAVKVTIPTQTRWNAGQFIYLRIPELSWLENHPFTVAALCDEKLPSAYGEQYRDMIVVFRPFGGFTKKLLQAGMKNGPNKVYRAFVDGPHGGIQRDLRAFDTVVFVAGGSGITAVISHLLLLVHKMREQSAVTTKVYVIWAMKRPEAAEWFREELRICRQFAPEDSVHCEFFITSAQRYVPTTPEPPTEDAEPETETGLHQRVDSVFAGIASKRNSALIREAAEGDPEKALTFGEEAVDVVQPLPAAHTAMQLRSVANAPQRQKAKLKIQIPSSKSELPQRVLAPAPSYPQGFDFGFDQPQSTEPFSPTSTVVNSPQSASKKPSPLQRGSSSLFSPASTVASSPPDSSTELLQHKLFSPTSVTSQEIQVQRFFPPPPMGTAQTAAQPPVPQPTPAQLRPMPRFANAEVTRGWSTEYGRPDIPALLRSYEENFGKRAAIFVCGPESLRRDVQRTVAQMQRRVWQGKGDEVYLRVESYRL